MEYVHTMLFYIFHIYTYPYATLNHNKIHTAMASLYIPFLSVGISSGMDLVETVYIIPPVILIFMHFYIVNGRLVM